MGFRSCVPSRLRNGRSAYDSYPISNRDSHVADLPPCQDFRTEAGVQIGSFKSVSLSFSDFLPPPVRDTIGDSVAELTLSIPFAKLFGWLELAEANS
jgi:hypothetical protein